MNNLALRQTREPRAVTQDVITCVTFGGRAMVGERNFIISHASTPIDLTAFINILSEFNGRVISIEIKEVKPEGTA